MKQVLDHDVPDELDGDLDQDEVYDDHLQPRGVRVGALRAQDVEQLPEYALRQRRNKSERGCAENRKGAAKRFLSSVKQGHATCNTRGGKAQTNLPAA